jgi:type IV secretory pathway TrbL component
MLGASVAFLVGSGGWASLNAQSAATICADGTTSASSGRGACSGHGGINRKATTKEKKVVKSETKAAKAVTKTTAGTQVTRICGDGTTTTATGRGACSGHGGVKGAEATSKTTGAVIPAPSTAATRSSLPTPRASARAQTRASANSAVRVGSGAADDNNPAGAIAQCKDGLYSHAVHHRGACSRHGGVATWL